MGVEVMGFEMAQAPAESVTEKENSFLHEKGNEKMDKESAPNQPIKFGFHEKEGNGNGVVDVNVPKDAVDEWPAPKQIHSFYLVRYRPLEDPKLKAELDLADKKIQAKNQRRLEIVEQLKAVRSEKLLMVDQLSKLKNDNSQYKTILDEKRREIEPLWQELGQLRIASGGGRYGLCSSEEELNDLIYSLQYRIQHESISLTEEKQILKDIKHLEGTRKKVIENAKRLAELQDSLVQKEAIEDHVKLMGVDLDGIKKEKQELFEKIKGLKEEIKHLQDELQTATNERDGVFEKIKKLRSQRDENNARFYRSRATITDAKKLAAEKDVKALEEFTYREVEKFMSLWNNDKAFRDDYEKRILPSLDSRQLSRDGRMRNPDEKPLVADEALIPSEADPIVKSSIKRPKEELKPTTPKDMSTPKKVQKEISKTDSKTTLGDVDSADQQINSPEKQEKSPSPVVKEVDEAKLKELRREEEIEKAKQALERKKKLAEKAAAKAAIRAQKEAEKKLKEREKKLRKKAAALTPATDPEPVEQAEAVIAEPENFRVKDEAPVPLKERIRKETAVRHRNRPRAGPDSLPKAILRRKKSTNYWMWAAPMVLFVLVLLALTYFYLL